ncbi:MAG: molecular chaperone TorD family protein [Desulfohalobiaceae bacterium]
MEYDWPGNVRELENVIEQAVVLGKGGRIGLEDLRQAYLVSSLHRLRVDHAQLFVGPFQLAAPPFGSVYLEQRQTLMGESTQMVKELYRQAGLEMDPEYNSPADHISAELEFLAYLLLLQGKLQTEEKDQVLELCRRFLHHHLGARIEPFTSLVEQGAGTDFYQALARLSRQLVLQEARAYLDPGPSRG